MDNNSIQKLQKLREEVQIKEDNLPAVIETQQLLSKYSKFPPASDEQIKNFIKALATNFQNQNTPFWELALVELRKYKPSYEQLSDMWKYFTKAFPWKTITLNDLLGYKIAIKTFDNEELSLRMINHPDQQFASIYVPDEDKYVYATIEDAKKTNAEYNLIVSMNEHNQMQTC